MAPANIPFHSASLTSGFASTTPVEEPLSVHSSPQTPTTPAPLLGASQPAPSTAGAVLSQNAPSARKTSTVASQFRSQAYELGNGVHTPTIAHSPRLRPRQRGGRRSGSSQGTGFTQKEVESVLNVIEKYLPLCKEEWDMVAEEHGETLFVENSTVDSIKRKFATLHRRKIPTGDPRMPDDVRRAKRLRFRMGERADIGEGAGAEETIGGILPSSDDEADDTMEADENELAAPNSPNVEHVPATPSNILTDSVDSPRPTMGVRPIVFKRSQARL
ncbi:hypothetical protein BWQ96_00646 [Gracilariopsis chorda]|uniref:Uncharacterized protein n=1 Tax=Gracilariopsis chorda TaxID=448386 RepID=A0A2V3J563_9FLOR|nr:hypothetical protein BWQ96_00646 [Gracilariopsis chorda]|eukprot:PXF49576.1 hypothetical protein BWQ96_00646 [Gracilariopsis chorda]